MATQMTQAQYKEKYGSPPVSNSPIQMTRAQYAAKYNSQPPVEPPEQNGESLGSILWNGLSNVVGSIEQPFISLASKPLQFGAKLAGFPDPYSGGVPAGLPGANTKVSVSPTTLKGTAGDLLRLGGEVGAVAAAPATFLGSVATGIASGAAVSGGGALQQDKNASEVIKDAATGGLVGGATAGLFAGLGKLISGIGNKIQKSVIKPTKPDIEDGFSMDTIKKYNLGGSLQTTADKTQAKLNELTTQLNQKLANSPNKVDLSNIFKQTLDELTDSSRLKGFGANAKVNSALEQLKGEVDFVNQAGGVSIPDAQVVKQAAGSLGAWKYGVTDPESKASEIVYNTFYRKLKTAIEDASPDGVKSINQELSKLIPVRNAIIRRLPVAERSGLISLNEMIGGVASTMNPLALGPTILAIISRSGTAGNVLSKIGNAITTTAAPIGTLNALPAEQVPSTTLKPLR